MKSLTAVQKTFKVFQTLSKVGMILAFVWAGITMVGLLCGLAWYSGGSVIGAGKEALISLTGTESLYQMMGSLLTDLVFALTEGTLFLFAFRYFKKEQADGTPFTRSGAEQVKRLGIRAIVLPLVAVILSAVFCEVFDLAGTAAGDGSNLTCLSVGIVLILASLVLRYGAELEGRDRAETAETGDGQHAETNGLRGENA